MRGLHGERHANATRRQRDHRRRTHSDEHHLPKNLRDIEKLSGEGGYENPVKKVEIELKVIFQNAGVTILVSGQNDKARETTKAESLGCSGGRVARSSAAGTAASTVSDLAQGRHRAPQSASCVPAMLNQSPLAKVAEGSA